MTVIRLGAVGLGRGFALTARALADHSGTELVAAATRSKQARQAYAFGRRAFESLDSLLTDQRIEMVYVATPASSRTRLCLSGSRQTRSGREAAGNQP